MIRGMQPVAAPRRFSRTLFGRCLVLSALLHLIPLAINPKVTIRPRERLVVGPPLVLLERISPDPNAWPSSSGPARALPLPEDKPPSPPRPQRQPAVLTASTADSEESEEKAVELWMLEQQPLVLKRVLPVYPEGARTAMIEGRVEVRLLLDRSGQVERVVQTTGPESLRTAAAEAALQWVFTPASQNGHPVKVWVNLPFTFRLE